MFFTCLMIASICNVNAQKNVATIRGILDVEETKTSFIYDGVESLFGNSRSIEVNADKNKYFSVQIKLDKPAYYKIKRNTLYITPGDNLDVVIREDPEKAEFKGKGAEANIYMRGRLFPKGGSFIKAGLALRSTLDSTAAYVCQEADKRIDQLDKLNNVTKEFKEIELARIKADIINSYLSYPSYARAVKGAKTVEEYYSRYNDFLSKYMPEIIQLIADINNPKFMDAEGVRYVLSQVIDNKLLLSKVSLDSKIQEIFTTLNKMRILSIDPTKENIDNIKEYITSMKSEDLKEELNKRIKQIGHLLKGSLAFDIQLEDLNGKSVRLSDFKGKYIYIDLWATWCGPCVGEAPHFEKLQKELNSDEIAFIAISVDTSKDAWKKFLQVHKKETKQFISDDRSIKQNWLLGGIPRFILIDKDFKIVDAFAKRPSEAVTRSILMNLIKK